MKKKLNEVAIVNELKGSSLYFQSPKKPEVSPIKPEESKKNISQKVFRGKDIRKISEQVQQEQKINDNTMVPRYHDTTQSTNQEILIEIIRKAVKQLGKEAATYRFTQEEKRALSDIVYQYKGQGIRTSENEITRTAINFLVEDYRQNGKNSILAQVIERLNA